MNKSIVALIFILLNFTQATKLKDVKLTIEKSTGMLWIFRYVNYVIRDNQADESAKVNANQKAYDWYMWSGYFEKFQSGVYKLQVSVAVNGGSADAVTTTIEVDNNKPRVLNVKGLDVPKACEGKSNVEFTLTNKGWTGVTKNLLISFTCSGAPSNEANAVNAETARPQSQLVVDDKKLSSKLVSQTPHKSSPEIIEGGKKISEIIQGEAKKTSDLQKSLKSQIVEQPVHVSEVNVDELQGSKIVEKIPSGVKSQYNQEPEVVVQKSQLENDQNEVIKAPSIKKSSVVEDKRIVL
jgi:hypothetical protein